MESIKKIISGPSVEPVTLSEVKDHLRVDHSEQDTLIQSLIQTAREDIESKAAIAIVYQQRAQYFKCWPPEQFELNAPELRAVSSVKYTDVDGNNETVSTDIYNVDINSKPGRVMLAYNQSWPTASLHEIDYPIEIIYYCGFAPTSDSPANYRENIPEGIKTAIKLLVEIKFNALPEQLAVYYESAIDSLITPYKIWSF